MKLGRRIFRKDSFFHKWKVEKKKIDGNVSVPRKRIEGETKKKLVGCADYKLLIRTQSCGHT